jgi:hypothetical protein
MGCVVAAPYNPFTSLFIQDPLFTYSLYLLPHVTVDEKRRLDRVYYPRTGEELTERYDVIVFRDPRLDHFSPRKLQDLVSAFRERGLVSVTAHSLSWNLWEPSILFDVSPISYYEQLFHVQWRLSFRTGRAPVFLPFVDLGVERTIGGAHGVMRPKQGATTWADIVPQEVPWLVSWKPGGGNPGMQWVFGDKFDPLWWGAAPGARNSNPYSIDLATNLILYSLDRKLVGDIATRRQARSLLSTFRSRELMVLSMLSWAEMFGANTFGLSMELAELEQDAEGAVDSYLDEDYAGTLSFIEEMDPRVLDMTARAERLKGQALFWIYLSEWLVTSGVSLVSAVVLWSLMVRRRAYKAVSVSRLKRIEEC